MKHKEATYKEIHHPISTSPSTTNTTYLITLLKKAALVILKKDRTKQEATSGKIAYYCWKGDSMLLGHLVEYPDYWTQGKNIVELEKNLKGLHDDIKSGVLKQDL